MTHHWNLPQWIKVDLKLGFPRSFKGLKFTIFSIVFWVTQPNKALFSNLRWTMATLSTQTKEHLSCSVRMVWNSGSGELEAMWKHYFPTFPEFESITLKDSVLSTCPLPRLRPLTRLLPLSRLTGLFWERSVWRESAPPHQDWLGCKVRDVSSWQRSSNQD